VRPANRSLISADANRAMFDGIARRYDLLNRLLSFGLDRGWRRAAVAALAPRDDQCYLDVGCGTGDVTLEVLRQAPGARVVGVDPSEQMLAGASRKVRQAGVGERVTLTKGDATALAFGDGAFGGVVSAFCIRNVVDRLAALSEMRRVVAPGGAVVLLEATTPHSRLLWAGHWLYMHSVAPVLGGLVARRPGAYRYLADSIDAFPQSHTMLGLMAEAGLADAQCTPLSGGLVSLYTGRRTSP